MNGQSVIRILMSAIFAVVLAISIASQHGEEMSVDWAMDGKQRYRPMINVLLLPVFLVIIAVIALLAGSRRVGEACLNFWLGIIPAISLYYLILMVMMPALRQRISARTCAALWMLPNYLYLTSYGYMKPSKPWLIVRVHQNLVGILVVIWLIGVFGILIWKISGHMVFRRQVLKGSRDAELSVRQIWNLEVRRANLQKVDLSLVISPQVTTPMTIGLFRITTVVVLPEREYTNEELALIFRHEIVHISREDNWSKFFLIFCTAMCWFNPLMWLAMRRSANDLELSCDETVLLDAEACVRRQYADLLLRTAGDDRGFTTCLSADAAALRYRLKRILRRRESHSGALVLGILFFLLCLGSGQAALAVGGMTGGDVLFEDEDLSRYTLRTVDVGPDIYETEYECMDETALFSYLASLPLERMTQNGVYEETDAGLYLSIEGPNGEKWLKLTEEYLSVTEFTGKQAIQTAYRLEEDLDSEWLTSLLIPMPAMKVELSDGITIDASLWSMTKTWNGETNVLQEDDNLWRDANGFFGGPFPEAILSFSHELAGDYTVTVETWDRKSCYVLSGGELEKPNVLPLAPYTAHYTLSGTFFGENGAVYEGEFRFDIGGSVP